MKDQWYGDNRDLVKWGVLLHLAEQHSADEIIQVAFLRQSKWGSLNIDGKDYPIPNAVLSHFRNVRNISKLVNRPQVRVIDVPFADREAYLKEVLSALAAGKEHRSIIFLDPDTGLAPQSPGPQHVLESELSAIWDTMKAGDLLVFYQHQTNKNGQPWIPQKRHQFENALGLRRGSAKLAEGIGSGIARDVVFFYSQKGKAS